MAFSENRVFIGIISSNEFIMCGGGSLVQYDWCHRKNPIRRHTEHDDRYRDWSDRAARQGPPKMDNHQRKPARGKERFYQSVRGRGALSWPSFMTSSLQNCRRIPFFLFKPLISCYLVANMTREQINNMWYLQTVEYYSAIKRNDLLIHTATRMTLDNILPSERVQMQKNTECLIPCLWNFQKRQTLRDSKQIRVIAWG